MTSKIGVYAFALGMILATSAFAQDKGTQSNLAPVAAEPEAVKPVRIRVAGNVQQAMLLRQVFPVYPPTPVTARIGGDVVFHAVIGTDG